MNRLGLDSRDHAKEQISGLRLTRDLGSVDREMRTERITTWICWVRVTR